jgi:hypothetical protein
MRESSKYPTRFKVIGPQYTGAAFGISRKQKVQ